MKRTTPETDAFENGRIFNLDESPFQLCLNFARKLERERDEARLQLEIETKYREKCIKCGHDWNPSLVESGWCIFCIQRETREERNQLRSVCDELKNHLQIGIEVFESDGFWGDINKAKTCIVNYNTKQYEPTRKH